MIVKESRNDLRKKRHARVRNKVSGTAECPLRKFQIPQIRPRRP